MARGFIKLGNTVLYVIKKIGQYQRTDIECRLFVDVTKIIDFQHITKVSLSERLNQLLQSKKLINKINRGEDSFFLIEDMIDMSINPLMPGSNKKITHP